MFDFEQFLLDNFGTTERLSRFLHVYGYTPPKHDTIYKWFHRRTIPAEWFALLVALLELERGGSASVNKYIGRSA